MYVKYLMNRIKNSPSKMWKVLLELILYRTGKAGETTPAWSTETSTKSFLNHIYGSFLDQGLLSTNLMAATKITSNGTSRRPIGTVYTL